MEVVHGTSALRRPPQRAAVAIGNFDGVHRGHRALIDAARALAAPRGGQAVVLTFDPHPARVLGRTAPPLLCSLAERLDLLAQAGVDLCVVEPFTLELAALAPQAFVAELLQKRLAPRDVVVGEGFVFGHKRAGDVALLGRAGAQAGFAVTVVPPVVVAGERVSSTGIRARIAAGDVAAAARWLGRWFAATGPVVRGAGRGRTFGIPTANVAARGELLPAPGIYAAWTRIEGAAHPSAVSLGTNPTFAGSGTLTLESHVLDWDGDLYDTAVSVEFVARLRDEAKYDSVTALRAQIDADIAQTRAVLAAQGETFHES